METLVKKEDNLLVSTNNKKNEVKKDVKILKPLNSREVNLKMYDYMIF